MKSVSASLDSNFPSALLTVRWKLDSAFLQVFIVGFVVAVVTAQSSPGARDDVQEAQGRFVVEAVEIPSALSADDGLRQVGRDSLPAGDYRTEDERFFSSGLPVPTMAIPLSAGGRLATPPRPTSTAINSASASLIGNFKQGNTVLFFLECARIIVTRFSAPTLHNYRIFFWFCLARSEPR